MMARWVYAGRSLAYNFALGDNWAQINIHACQMSKRVPFSPLKTIMIIHLVLSLRNEQPGESFVSRMM